MEELENKAEGTNELDQLKKELEQIKGSLNYERSRRKEVEKKLASREEDDKEDIKKAEADIREKLQSGKSGLSDEVIDDIMESIGKPQAEAQVRAAKQNREKEIMELKRNPIYMDIDEYADSIRDLMKKGLSAEQAYWAVAGENKFSSSDTKDEEEQKKLTKERASEGFVDQKPAGGESKPTYTAKERANADILGISPEEYKARSKESFSIDELIKLNKKFKKED